MRAPLNHQQILEPPSLPRRVRVLTVDDLSAYRVRTITERLGLAALIAVREHAPVLDRKLGVMLVEWFGLCELLSGQDRSAFWRLWESHTMSMLTVEVADLESDDCRGRCRDCHAMVVVLVAPWADWTALASVFGP